MADSRPISRVALLGLSSTTHSFNMGQRYYPAGFSQAGDLLTVNEPADANLVPPGYYLLFVVDDADVPSRGLIVAIDADAPGCADDAECDDDNPCTDDACSAGLCSSTDSGSCSTDPVAVYPFEEGSGSTARDFSGNGFDAVLQNGAGWAPGQFGSAVDIDGGTEYVDLPNGLVQPCDDFTFATWVWLDSNETWSRIFDFGNDTATNMFLTPAAGNPDTLRFALKVPGINGGAEEQISFPFAFPLATWTHVAVVLEGNTGRLYLNGSEVASAGVVGNPVNMGVTVHNWLGESQYSADPALNGRLDEARISCRAYSGQEIDDLVNPSPPDPGESSQVLVAGHTAGNLQLQYTPACGSTNHDVYYASLPPLAQDRIDWTGQVCDIGVAGTHVLPDPEPGSSYMFVVVGNREGTEGSYGRSSAGEERPVFQGAPCSVRTQALGSPCSPP